MENGKLRVAINGFGRIGRLAFRAGLAREDMEFVGINDLLGAEDMAYLLRYDSVHGRFPGEVRASGGRLYAGGREIPVFCERDPALLPWGALGADCVIESTGAFTSAEKAAAHLRAGAKKVVISAPSPDAPMFVMGVNEDSYEPGTPVVSAASCTTNCLAPLAKVVNRRFGIVSGLMTTVHAATATQRVVDGVSKKDRRGGRAAASNIIPSATGAAKAVGRVIPELDGRLTGMSLRVPVSDVSVVDLTANLARGATWEGICHAVREAAEGDMRGVIGITEDPVVSSDFVGETRTCVFDATAGILLTPTFVKLVAWYDNEWGYSCKLLDLARHAADADRLACAAAPLL